ncbi:hypothetical protein Egran_02355 [Elaphomyces granulatus]|uniref:Store-operated calcium entry-associated regulatory factor n=1 Tax=Elaphomyces granulatus TaxID=519963 RepID=A0A232M0N8_9EURO|nr:hypothetical protein Egran_02355 [Elaphomyces granulatus]
MHSSPSLLLLLLLSFSGSAISAQKPPGRDAILLSKVGSLTLHGDQLTTSRRVAPVPQLKCTGPSKKICKLHPVHVMRCTNQGYDYDEEDIQWTCSASLPSEFKLGATDVICEGYRNSKDKWVLKGSCGVEYRLLLTELGERRFGSVQDTSTSRWLGGTIFFLFICFFLILIWYGRDGINDGGRGWGWGGGDGGGYDPRGPPPPYDGYRGNGFFSPYSGPSWRPGFWSGALGGAAAGYHLGRRNQGGSSFMGRTPSSSYSSYGDPGEGSSTFSSTRSSTGFGSTRRR